LLLRNGSIRYISAIAHLSILSSWRLTHADLSGV
jgi:hypothetical protein